MWNNAPKHTGSFTDSGKSKNTPFALLTEGTGARLLENGSIRLLEGSPEGWGDNTKHTSGFSNLPKA